MTETTNVEGTADTPTPTPTPDVNVRVERQVVELEQPMSAEMYMDLTDDLRRANGLRLVREGEVSHRKDDLKLAKELLEAAEKDVFGLVKTITRGRATVETTIEVHYDYDLQVVREYTLEGDLLNERNMTPEQTQATLDLQAQPEEERPAGERIDLDPEAEQHEDPTEADPSSEAGSESISEAEAQAEAEKLALLGPEQMNVCATCREPCHVDDETGKWVHSDQLDHDHRIHTVDLQDVPEAPNAD